MVPSRDKQAATRTSRVTRSLSGLALLIGTGAIAAPAPADDSDICAKSSGPEAISACSRVIANTPVLQKREDAYVNRGVEYYRAGRTDDAIADYTAALKLDPTDATALSNRGDSYNKLGNPKRALDDLYAALRINPRYTHAYFNRGNAYLALKQYDHAIADYNQAIRLDPKYAKALYNRGQAKRRKGNKAEGDADVAIAVQMQPSLGDSH